MGHLSKDEERLLAAFAQLSNEQQEIVLEAIQVYARNDHPPTPHPITEQQA